MSKEAQKVEKALEEFVSKLVQKVTLAVTSNLAETTPVDTGWARANWIPSLGAPVLLDLQNTQNREEQVPGAVARQATAQAAVASSQVNLDKGTYITNNVPYIVELNQGSSRQAPSGFVQNAITKAINKDIK